MSAKGEGRSQVYAQIVGDVVKVRPSEAARLSVSFDKKPTQVRQYRSNKNYSGMFSVHFGNECVHTTSKLDQPEVVVAVWHLVGSNHETLFF